jgi:hypothetical protein
MFEKWTQHLSRMDLHSIAYELTRRIRRKRSIDPLNPVPQTKPLSLSEELSKIVDEIEAELEAQYQTPIDKIDEETELKIINEFDDLSYERLKASPDYDPEKVKKLIEDLLNTVPYHKSLRYGQRK